MYCTEKNGQKTRHVLLLLNLNMLAPRRPLPLTYAIPGAAEKTVQSTSQCAESRVGSNVEMDASSSVPRYINDITFDIFSRESYALFGRKFMWALCRAALRCVITVTPLCRVFMASWRHCYKRGYFSAN